ncbi:hypothetical protein JCM3775_001327 [Rhodotorula graminis]|uniref:Protein CPL1-like domain-containing protein n=1 Tax=Rhodotorula graminis (strain WP1) TaxID=578459 RepID=A0A194S6N7_RHOGW|nr:uncharacterized protein RHOBADRAFT_64704 [Rhodotorula graminis WP1]KPV76257.1 hypothetical protein RHOBADRAFT_64704 [Rhodotorula graminis WP1]
MHATLALASLASLASIALAQIPSGYGRFPCTLVNGDGTFSADPNQCADDALINPAGVADDTGIQGSAANPTGAMCTLEAETGAYFCGIAGAECSSDANCDNGTCDLASGTCQGGFLQDCGGDDANCSGYLYCTNADQTNPDPLACGEDGVFCQDPFAVSDGQSAAEIAATYDQFCSSGYCSNVDGNCGQRFTLGQDCSADVFGCGTTDAGVQLTCVDNAGVQTCQVEGASPAARSRSRRAALHRRNLCPASHTACAVEGAAKGFECIDVSSNIEQCGACASAGGVDCTAIEGVAAVGCVAGTCEIWSCEDGFTFDAATGACTSA